MEQGCVCVLNCERVQEVLCSEMVPEMCSEKVPEMCSKKVLFGKGQRKGCVRKGTKEGMRSLRDAGGNVQRNVEKSVRKCVSRR